MNGLFLGLLAMLPMVGMSLFWRRHPRRRSRGLAGGLGAIALAMLIASVIGPALPDPDNLGTGMVVPFVAGGAVLGISFKQMVRDQD